jgi:hypothetical protein
MILVDAMVDVSMQSSCCGTFDTKDRNGDHYAIIDRTPLQKMMRRHAP